MEKEIEIKTINNEIRKSIFKSFLSIFEKKKVNIVPTVIKKELTELEKKEQEIESHVTGFLNSNLLFMVKKFIDNGYVLSDIQKELWDKSLIKKLNTDGVPYLKELIDRNIEVKKEILIPYLFSFYKKSEDEINLTFEKYPDIKIYVESLLKEKNFGKGVWNYYYNTLASVFNYRYGNYHNKFRNYDKDYGMNFQIQEKRELLLNLNNAFKGNYSENMYVMLAYFFPHIKTHISLDSFTQSIFLIKRHQDFLVELLSPNSMFQELESSFNELKKTINNQYINTLLNRMEIILDTEFQDEVNELLNQVKNLSGKNFIKNIVTQNISEKIKMDFVNLPKEAEILINKIKELFEECLLNKDKLSVVSWQKAENIWQKHLPKALESYLSISDDYKTTLKNAAGENAQELMLKSLKNIKEILETYTLEINEENLRDLSANQKHTSNLKVR